MKILLINKISPEFGGGAELVIKEIGKRLSKKGHTVFLLTTTENMHSPNFTSLDGIPTYYIPSFLKFAYVNKKLRYLLPRYFFYLSSPPFIVKFVRELNVDIIHDYASPIPSLATLIGRWLKIPTILTVHEVLLKRAFKYYNSITAFGKLLGDYFVKILSPDHIIAVSGFTKKKLIELGVEEERISVIPNAVDYDMFRPPNNFEKKNSLSVVCVSRLVPQKRIHHIIIVAKKVVKYIPDVHFYIIGKGKHEDELRSIIIKMGLSKNVHILGFLPINEVVRYLQQATIFVSTSIQEGFGLAAAEAMACGTPVVAYDVPALNELITSGKDGLLVKDGDIRQLSQAIIYFLKNREIAKTFGRRAAQKIREKYDWDKATDRVVSVYERVTT
jgi:glycosyltransferase involved in cell wall biosynthesis